MRDLWTPSRRALLLGGMAGASALALPRRARAGTVSAADRKFIFIFASGGWDDTLTIADMLDQPIVTPESGTERGTAGNLTFVDAVSRPSVRSYYEKYHGRTAIIQGVSFPTISHEVGIYLGLTGKKSGLDPDWPSLISASAADRFAAPTLVVTGPSLPGDRGWVVLRIGPSGQLADLFTEDLSAVSDLTMSPLSKTGRDAIDAYVAARSGARVKSASGARDLLMAERFELARDHAAQVREAGKSLDFGGVSSLAGSASLIGEVLGSGLSRCVMIGGPPSLSRDWDTHFENFTQQSVLWENLFAGLVAINEVLDTTPGEVGATLADETVVVVFSEFGRLPYLNAFEGKDHWPYTSMLVSGSGVAGDQIIGGYGEDYGGKLVDLDSGEVYTKGEALLTSTVGAALLTLGDVDPAEWVDDSEPLRALLA